VALIRRYGAQAAIVVVALFVVWAFAATVLAVTHPFGLPLDDSYVYLAHAKQLGRAHPFTHVPGAGSSVLWPVVLAPFWTLGARGHALVWVSYVVCAGLYVVVALGVWRLSRTIAGDVAALVAAGITLAIAPFAWCALSGMETALASALLLAMLLLLTQSSREGTPSLRLALVMAAASLARPEAMVIVFAVCGVCAVQRRRTPRAAAWWLAPLAAPIAWLVANRLLAGHVMPGLAWHPPVSAMLKGLFWDSTSPLVWPTLVALLVIAGAVRVVWWARREKRPLVGGLVIAAPFAMMLAAVASSGEWDDQRFRTIAPAFPLLAILAGIGATPPARFRLPATAAIGLVFAVFAWRAWRPMRSEMLVFAQGAMDTNTQVVRIGQYIHERLPDARVMGHAPGAIAYYGDETVDAMPRDVANNGPGSQFEMLESMPPEQRPTHFAVYPSRIGQTDFFGDVLLHTVWHPALAKERLGVASDMQLIAATWDHAGTAERPLNDHTGWALVDRIDVADLASERAHGWHGELGGRTLRDPSTRWSFVERETKAGLLIDGGRTIRGGSARFTVHVDPKKPTRIAIRTGGAIAAPGQDVIKKPVTLKLLAGTRVLGTLTVTPPTGAFTELTFNLQPHALRDPEVEVTTSASGPYRVFHWFVLQPE
jgi:hypothetical protein